LTVLSVYGLLSPPHRYFLLMAAVITGIQAVLDLRVWRKARRQ
jgi:hypothetical protein